MTDMMQDWDIVSPPQEGFHEVIGPQSGVCRAIRFFRLNLGRSRRHTLSSADLEMNAVLVSGSARFRSERLSERMDKLDSFYLPAGIRAEIEAETDCIFYIPAALYEGIGVEFFRKYRTGLPEGEIYQVHGKGASRREVFFTVNPEVPASRLICGYAFGGEGSWTSWPPHDHGEHLEEVYCYFDMPAPRLGVHFSYLKSGGILSGVGHVVSDGHVVLIPRGYHPTVALPGGRNTYLWAMASLSHSSRRYDLAVKDPCFADF
jgi:5-deoxy-glucuronate isomerase